MSNRLDSIPFEESRRGCCSKLRKLEVSGIDLGWRMGGMGAKEQIYAMFNDYITPKRVGTLKSLFPFVSSGVIKKEKKKKSLKDHDRAIGVSTFVVLTPNFPREVIFNRILRSSRECRSIKRSHFTHNFFLPREWIIIARRVWTSRSLYLYIYDIHTCYFFLRTKKK